MGVSECIYTMHMQDIPHFWRQHLLNLSLNLTVSDRQVGHCAPRNHLSLSPSAMAEGVGTTPRFLHEHSRSAQKACPHACTASTLHTGPSPEPLLTTLGSPCPFFSFSHFYAFLCLYLSPA